MLTHTLAAAIAVYMPQHVGRGTEYRSIAVYGEEYQATDGGGATAATTRGGPLRLLFHGGGHYETLVGREDLPASKL